MKSLNKLHISFHGERATEGGLLRKDPLGAVVPVGHGSTLLLAKQTPALIEHFEDWGMVHAGAPGKESKSETILFCPVPPHVYSDRATCDGADLSDVQLPAGRLMPAVS